MCFSIKKNNKQAKRPINCFLQDAASAGIWSLQTSIVMRPCQAPGDRFLAKVRRIYLEPFPHSLIIHVPNHQWDARILMACMQFDTL